MAKRQAKKVDPGTALAKLEQRTRPTYPGESLMAPVQAPPGVETLPAQALGDEVVLGALGLIEVKLTPEEEKVLNRPVDETRISIKPTGQPYLSHPEYTRWFNEAFGRLGWSIVPVAKPRLDGSLVLCPYVLYIHGKPAAFAYGEQEYFAGNREQTFGDVVEATVASALRRLAKRLGVGLELWDRSFLDRWIEEHAVEVHVLKKGRDGRYNALAWRRRDDGPLPGEFTPGAGKTVEGDHTAAYEAQEPEHAQRRARTERPAGSNSKAQEPITEGQVRRLWVIVRNSGRSDEVVKTWLKTRFGLETSKAIRRVDYDFIVRCIEATGSLPLTGDPARDPGQEG